MALSFKNYWLASSIVIFLYFSASAQSDDGLYAPANIDRISNILPPAPAAGSLGKYGDLSVGMVNGTPNVKIDLMTLKTNNLSVPISINYSSSGFKVNAVGSQIGLNWVFNLGGVITRTVQDDPDELSSWPTVPSNLSNLTQTVYDFLSLESQNKNDNEDFQRDIFNYNLPGYSGKFILDANLQPVPIPYANIKIEQNFANSGTGNIEQKYSFKITDPNGIAYFFGGDAVESSGMGTYGPGSSRYKDYDITASAWQLRKITHPNGDSIVFYYSNNFYYYLSDISQTDTRRRRNTDTGPCSPDNPAPLPSPASMSITVSKMYNSVQRLDSIKMSNGQKLTLNYLINHDMSDSYTNYILDKIVFSGKESTTSKQYKFQYTFITTNIASNLYNNADDATQEKVFLTKLREINSEDSTISKDYLFSYNDWNSLPKRLAYSSDYWGYYNGATSNPSLLYISDPTLNNTSYLSSSVFTGLGDRTPNPTYAAKGLLSKITYPTGGNDSIIYEGNTYSGPQQNHTNIQNITVNAQSVGNSDATPLTVQQSFTPNQDQTVSVRALCNYIGSAGYEPELYKIKYSIYDNTNSSYVLDTDPNSIYYQDAIQNLFLDAGDHTVLTRGHDVYLQANHSYTITVVIFGLDVVGGVSLTYQNFDIVTVQANFITGGVRVKKVISFDPVSQKQIIKRYYYAFPTDTTLSSLSSEFAMTDFYNMRNHFIHVPCAYNSCVGHDAFDLAIYSLPKAYINLYNGSNVGYPCVLESLGEHFENGGIEHRFQTVRNAPPTRLLGGQAVTGPTTDFDWEHGLEIYSRIFNNAAQTLSETKNVYSIDNRINMDYPGYLMCKNWSDEGLACAQGSSGNKSVFDVATYSVYQRWVHNDSSISTIYDQNTANIKAVKWSANSYDNLANTLPTKIFSNRSNGDITYSKIKCLQDYANYQLNPAFNNLNSLHSIGVPIESLTILKKAGGTEYVIGGKIVFYRNSSGKLLVDSISILNLQSPVLLSSFSESSVNVSGVFSYDSRYKAELIYDSYGPNGTILQLHKFKDVIKSYLWDYSNSLLICETNNADSASIAHTSFESDGTGNWAIPSTVRDTITMAVTGRKSYDLSSGAVIKSGLISSKKYVVSYWSTNGAKAVPGTVAGYPITGKTIGSWTYFEHKITGQTSVSVSGTGNIDELRLYPDSAQMTTYTYDPLVGMTSQCDLNNKITYYEYDGLQRLKVIRDQDKNIIKNFQYNYASGCGPNCAVLPMQTFNNSNTISYPVGVFNVNRKLLGNATNQAQYVSLWNADTADQHRGILVAGIDSMHFNLTINSGVTSIPNSVTGCRYYQFDLTYNNIDGVRNLNGAYVDFGDGIGMHLGVKLDDSSMVRAPNTTLNLTYSSYYQSWEIYWIHTYPDTSLKTLTFYHNDDNNNKTEMLDNFFAPATSLLRLKNLRGNLPQNMDYLGASSYFSPTALSVANISNWSTINTIKNFTLNNGDGINPNRNLNYSQDFMANNQGLEIIITTGTSLYRTGYRDSTFKISRLKSNWNTYFTRLRWLSINDDHWNREDLSALKQLSSVTITATTQNHQDSPTTPAIPIPSGAIDNIINQIKAGAGQAVSNGAINIVSGGTARTTASDASVDFLKSKGWTVIVNGITQ